MTSCPYTLDASASDIHAENAALRAAGPAANILLPGGVPAWSVTDPGLARRLLTHPLISKDARQHWPGYAAAKAAGWPLFNWLAVHNTTTAYGADHRRLRRLITPAFTASRVRALSPTISALTNELLDGLATERQPVDILERFARKLPLMVISAMLGVPEEMHGTFRAIVSGLVATNRSEAEAAADEEAVQQRLGELVALKRAHPGPDVISALIETYDEETNTRLTHQELLDTCQVMIGAGHETTVNLLDHAIVNLCAHPDQLAVAIDSGGWDAVVEETLRHQAPIANILPRVPVEDVHDVETGLTFLRGDMIVINYAAIGRAPAVDSPNAFDINRSDKEHLSFGYGPHFCPGATLARLEAEIALRALFTRFPDLTLVHPAHELRPRESFISNAHQEVLVRLG